MCIRDSTHTHTQIHTVCTIPHTHTLQTVKLTSPDYTGRNPDDAVKDFELRIENYKLVYVPLDKDVDK